MPESWMAPPSDCAPLLSMNRLTRFSPLTASTKMPLSALSLMFMNVSDGFVVWLRTTPSAVVFWIVPPVPAAPVPRHRQSPPLLPVLLSTMPLARAVRRDALEGQAARRRWSCWRR